MSNTDRVYFRQLLSGVRPRDQVGKARKQLALDHAKDVERLDAELLKVKSSIGAVIAEHPTKVSEVRGVGPVMTALILGEVGDVRRFPSKAHFASYTGTAPVDVSSGDHVRHRLNRGGNRRLNYALHIAALVQVRLPGPGRDYYLRKRDAGKTALEAMRCLKRRLSDVVFRALLDDLDNLDQSPPQDRPAAADGQTGSRGTPEPTLEDPQIKEVI